MTKFVLSSKIEVGCPIGLAEDYGLFDKFYEDIKVAKKKIGSFPWYADSDKCQLPVDACYITKLKRIDFGIRNLHMNLYLISEDFLKIIKNQSCTCSKEQKVTINNRLGEKVTDKSYFIIRIRNSKFYDAVDTRKSVFNENDEGINLKKLFLKDTFTESLFSLDELSGVQSTLFCTKEFRDEAIQADIKGVNFFEETKAKWQSGFDYLLNMGKKEPANTVWPI